MLTLCVGVGLAVVPTCTAKAADRTPPRLSVQLSGQLATVGAPSCLDPNSGPATFLRVRSSEAATITVRVVPLLGVVRFMAGSSTSVAVPAGPSTVAISYSDIPGTVRLPGGILGAGLGLASVTAADTVGNRALLPALSNPIVFGVSPTGRGPGTFPCDRSGLTAGQERIESVLRQAAEKLRLALADLGRR